MGQPLCHQISSPTLFCSALPVSCPCPTRNMALSWWPTGMNPLELPVLSLILYAAICLPSYFNAEDVLPPVQSSHFPVCPGFSSAVSSLALLVILLLSWLSSSSSFSSWWTPTDLCGSEVTWPRGSAPPLYSHSIPSALTASTLLTGAVGVYLPDFPHYKVSSLRATIVAFLPVWMRGTSGEWIALKKNFFCLFRSSFQSGLSSGLWSQTA